jgi:hypothetical protein
MSKKILLGKLSANPAVSAESLIVVEKKKEKKKRAIGLLLFLLAVGLGALTVGSIPLLAPVSFYGYVGSPSSIDYNSGRGDGAAVIPSVLAASAIATDGEGTVIENNGLTKSGEMIITGYSDSSSYSAELHCAIDSLPAYCSGSPVTFSGLPPGGHVFTVIEPTGEEITVQSFGWDILE